jgi:nucleoside 2-deoxyribosyltransferase
MWEESAVSAEPRSEQRADRQRLCVFVGGPFKALVDSSTGVVPIASRRPVARVVRHFERCGHEVLSAHRLERWGQMMVTPEECTRRDYDWIQRADVVVAFPGAPASPGTHVEVGWASAWGKPLVLILERDGQHAHLVLGLGALYPVQYLTYEDSDSFLDELSGALKRLRVERTLRSPRV